MSELPSIDRLREQRWDIVRMLIAKHQQLVANSNKICITIDIDEVKPDHIVEQKCQK